MGDSIFDELDDLFKETANIIDDDLKFKHKLQLGDDAYKKLKTIKKAKDFIGSIAVGIGAFFSCYIYWSSQQSTSVKLLGHEVYANSPPIGWFIFWGIFFFIITFYIKKFFKKAEEKTMHKIPKFLDTPLNIVALTLSEVFIVPAIKIATVDGVFSKEEEDYIKSYFVNDWGFNKNFIDNCVESGRKKIECSYDDYGKSLRNICANSKELKFKTIANELISFLDNIIKSDGNIATVEIEAYNKFKKILMS